MEGKAKFAMVAMIIPAIVNIILDIIFIKVGLGMFGAALATSISYFMCFLFVLWFFCVELRLKKNILYYTTHNKRDYHTEFDFFKTRRSEYFSNHTQSYFVLLRGEHSIAVYG
jgi:Na+-driven multidrug efflux pump